MSEIFISKPINLKEYVQENILFTPEAIEILDISRARMSKLIKDGKIKPIKSSGAISIFLKEDIMEKKKELEALRRKYRPFDYE